MSPIAERILLRVAPWMVARLIRWIHRIIKPESIGNCELKRLWANGRYVIFAALLTHAYQGSNELLGGWIDGIVLSHGPIHATRPIAKPRLPDWWARLGYVRLR